MQKNGIELDKDGNCTRVVVNPGLYPLDVIYSASYVFIDKAYIMLDGDPKKEIVVELRPKSKGADLEKLGRDFLNELLNYCMYKSQVEKNSELRKLILQRALLTNDILEEEGESESYIDDPDGIAIPWEEKYGKEKKNPSTGKAGKDSGN